MRRWIRLKYRNRRTVGGHPTPRTNERKARQLDDPIIIEGHHGRPALALVLQMQNIDRNRIRP